MLQTPIEKKKKTVEWLEFSLLQGHKIKHGIFLNSGGVSTGPFSTLNMGGAVGDNPAHVLENRNRVREALGIDRLIFAKQVHGNAIANVDLMSSPVGEADAIVTNQPMQGLSILHADCQAAIVYDPITRSLANIHAGWRGNVNNIYRDVVNHMKRTFSSKPENLLVCISPSLGPNNAQFINYRKEFPEYFWSYQVRPNYFNLWEVAIDQFKKEGVLSHHVEVAGICTKEDTRFFSYRRAPITGRNATVAALY